MKKSILFVLFALISVAGFFTNYRLECKSWYELQ